MTPEELASYIQSQDLELRVAYGFGAECVRMHPDDARILDAPMLLGMKIYVDRDVAPGEPEIIHPQKARRRYGSGVG